MDKGHKLSEVERNASSVDGSRSSSGSLQSENESREPSLADKSDVVAIKTHDKRGRPFYRKRVTLYHYTTKSGAQGIKRDLRIKENHAVFGWKPRDVHGTGVYFTRWDPRRQNKRELITNLFVNTRRSLHRVSRFHDRIQYVVKVEFNENDPIIQIIDGRRDLFLHEGDVDLRKYEGKYWIYANPRAPTS